MTQVEWMALVAAAVGAFLGSGSAFVLESRRQSATAKREQLAALQEAQFALGQQLASLKAIRQVSLDPVRDEPERHLKLGRLLYEFSDLRVRVQDIAFLVGQGERELLSAIEQCRTMFGNTLVALRRRDQELDRAFYSDACAVNSFDEETGEASLLPDPRHVADLKMLTDSLFECFDTAIKSHEAVWPEIRAAIDKRS